MATLYLGRVSGESPWERVSARSRVRSLGRAITAPPAERVVVWHLGLLPSIRFVGARKAKVFLFLHGIEAWAPLNTKMKRLVQQVDIFLTNSNHTWDRFVEINPAFEQGRHRTVQLGIDEPADVVAPPDQAPTAVTIGRMLRSENYKGHEELIQTWPRVLERVPDAKLTFVGEGDQEADFKELVAGEGLEPSIDFAGRVSDEIKRELLQRSRCLLLPSKGEGFGLVYLEAMRLGRPCLCGVEDAGPEIVNPPEAGLSVDPQDSDALAESIISLMTPGPEWDRRSSRAKARYDLSFTASHFGSRLKRALEEP